MGHNWVRQISRFHDVVVLTDERNRRAIEGYPYGDRVRFEFVRAAGKEFGTSQDFRDWRGGEWWAYYRFTLKSFILARRLFRDHPFDLVHLVTWANFRWPFLLALLPCPSILGPVGGGDRYPPAFLRGCVYERVRGLSLGLLSRVDPMLRMTLARATLILAATKATVEALPAAYGHKVRHLAMGIDLAELGEPHTDRRSRRDFVVLWAGLLIRRKALDLLVAALPRLRAELGDTFRIVVCGDGPERLRLEAQAGALGVRDRLEFRGWVPREEMIRAYAEADVFCFTSLRETTPVALMEAMANRLPVVCLAHSGPGEIVTQECGIRIPPLGATQVVDDLASALINLAKDSDLRQAMGVNARKRVEEVYDWNRGGDHVARLYEEVCA
jgi:glycosyltransferase involved in cell wall biosynthesis